MSTEIIDRPSCTETLVSTEFAELRKKYDSLLTEVEKNHNSVAEFKRHADVQVALNNILYASVQPKVLDTILKEVLLLVLEIPWLALEKKGCIFLVKEHQKTLEMTVHHNLGRPLLNMCANVAFGRCLCGRAAQTQQMVFKDCVDADHENLPAGLTPHGHYNVPIVSKGATVGVLNLYVKHGHQPDATERQFLSMVASALASTIERNQTETRLHTLSRAVESSGSIIIITDCDGKIEYVNRQFTTVTGYTAEEVIGKSPRMLDAYETPNNIYEDMRKTILSGNEWRGDFYNKKKDGQRYWLKSIVSPIRDNHGDVSHIVSIQEDVTKQYELAKKLSYQASHDELTGLVNRREFEGRLERVVSENNPDKVEHVLCFMDLDQFKVVNDTCGHHAGDALLRQISKEFLATVRKSDTLGRLGGDEFGILMEHCSPEHGRRVADLILKAAMDFQFIWEGRTFKIGISIGLVAISEETVSLEEIMKCADAACYMAKDLGRNRVHVYQAEDEDLAKKHGEMQWVERINQALEEDRLVLYAQPIVAVDESFGDPLQYEILLRMMDSEGNSVPPGAFLPSAERYNLITKIDRWVVKTVFAHYNTCRNHVARLTKFSINLSGQSITNVEFLNFVLDEMKAQAIPAEKICFEITETAAISNLNKASKFISVLRRMGCQFALDDFGSGLSSFGYLKTLKVDYLKIDGMFVKDIVDDVIDFAMVKSINEVGQLMGMKTIAEFVENDEIKEMLKLIGVNYVQGYGVGKPIPIGEILC